MVPRQCPLVLLVKIGWRQDQAVGSEEGRVVGSWVFGLSLVFGRQHDTSAFVWQQATAFYWRIWKKTGTLAGTVWQLAVLTSVRQAYGRLRLRQPWTSVPRQNDLQSRSQIRISVYWPAIKNILCLRTGDVTGGWTDSYHEDRPNDKMGGVGSTQGSDEKCIQKLNRKMWRDHLEDLSIDGKIIRLLERILNMMPEFKTVFIWHRLWGEWRTVVSTVMNIQVA